MLTALLATVAIGIAIDAAHGSPATWRADGPAGQRLSGSADPTAAASPEDDPTAGTTPSPSTSAPRTAATPAPTKGPTQVDARQPQDAAAKRRAELRSAQLKARPAVQRLVHRLGAQAIVDIDPLTGTPRQVARLNGLLTAPSSKSPSVVALGYLHGQATALGLDTADIDGLTLARDYVDVQGTHHLSFTQSADDLPLFGNGVKAAVTKRGQLVNLTGSPVHGLAAPAAVTSPQGLTTAAAAIRQARQRAGEQVTAAGPDDRAEPVLFQTASGARRAWQVVTMSAAQPALTVLDAADGAVLYRDPLGSDFASAAAPTPYSADVWANYPGAPGVGGTAHTVSLTGNGWLPAGTGSLSGNNVHTYTDINGDGLAASTEEVLPTGTSGYRFALHPTTVTGEPCSTNVCTWVPNTAYSWRANGNASRTATQNFYFINTWHDYLQSSPIGFTEAAGNFQKVNGTGQGKGNDAVKDESLSGAAVNNGLPTSDFIDNADFDTPPDGQSPTMRMFLFHEPFTTAAGDPFLPVAGSDSADIVYHEYTHGLSHRLVVDASNNPALDSLQGSSMGEAWSDWYGLDYLVNNSATTGMTDGAGPDVIEGRYVLGATSTTGIRSMPIDCPVGSAATACTGIAGTGGGGYTYGDVKTIWTRTRGDVHAAGEPWAQTLWDLRTSLIAELGQTPGVQRAESLVTRGMELSPTYPSFLDMRNAIIAADVADYGGDDVDDLWSVFAARGMGFFASSQGGDDTAPVESFDLPPAPGSPTGTLSGVVTNSVGGGVLPGVTIGVSGHDSGFPGDYVATTDSHGAYTISGMAPGTYPSIYATGGVDRATRSLTVTAGVNPLNWSVARDWASSAGGARIVDAAGVDASTPSCAPAGAIDQSATVGWSATTTQGTPYFFLKLPAPVDVTAFAIDPSNICGDGRAMALGKYQLDTSVDGITWVPSVAGTFGTANIGHLNSVTPAAGSDTAVRWVRLTLLAPQVAGVTFIDLAELEVYGPQSAGLPRHNHQGGHPPIPR